MGGSGKRLTEKTFKVDVNSLIRVYLWVWVARSPVFDECEKVDSVRIEGAGKSTLLKALGCLGNLAGKADSRETKDRCPGLVYPETHRYKNNTLTLA